MNHDGNINQLDIVYLGNSLPKLTGGFGFKVQLWRLGFWAAQFNYRVDYDIVNLAVWTWRAWVRTTTESGRELPLAQGGISLPFRVR